GRRALPPLREQQRLGPPRRVGREGVSGSTGEGRAQVRRAPRLHREEARRSSGEGTMKRALLSLASLLGVAAFASSCRSGDVQADPGRVPDFVPREKASVFFVGHSLINFEMPKNAEVLARSLGLELTWDAQIIDSAPLEIHATHPERSQSKRVDVALPSGRYDTLVMTEAVPIDDMIRYRDPVRHAAAIARLASKGRPDARIFLHEVWMHRDRPRGNPFMKRVDWRRFLDDDLPKWEELADAIAEETGHPIALLPAGRALGRL